MNRGGRQVQKYPVCLGHSDSIGSQATDIREGPQNLSVSSSHRMNEMLMNKILGEV